MEVPADAYPAPDVRAELDRILASDSFTASHRNRRFLEYVVEETLAGRGRRLKAYNIATSVFGRPDHFDPQSDPIVRMEARRIRRALERFYLIEGQLSPIRITMPTGGYVPEFLSAPESVAEAPQGGIETAERSVVITAFDDESPSPLHSLNVGFTYEVMLCLHRRGVAVISGPAISPRARILRGGLAFDGHVLSATALLINTANDRVLWGNTVQRTVGPSHNILAVRDEAADEVAKRLDRYLCGPSARPQGHTHTVQHLASRGSSAWDEGQGT